MAKFRVQTYDDFKKEVFDEAKIFTNFQEASDYARKEASKWCEHEKPKHYVLNENFDLFIGDSDFGVLLIRIGNDI